eukprot:2861496-Pyramimonas_sp.AAC.1
MCHGGGFLKGRAPRAIVSSSIDPTNRVQPMKIPMEIPRSTRTAIRSNLATRENWSREDRSFLRIRNGRCFLVVVEIAEWETTERVRSEQQLVLCATYRACAHCLFGLTDAERGL